MSSLINLENCEEGGCNCEEGGCWQTAQQFTQPRRSPATHSPLAVSSPNEPHEEGFPPTPPRVRSSEAGPRRPEPPLSPGRGAVTPAPHTTARGCGPPPPYPGRGAAAAPSGPRARGPTSQPEGREANTPRVPPAPPRRGLPAPRPRAAASCRLGNGGLAPRHAAPPPAARDPSQPIPGREGRVT